MLLEVGVPILYIMGNDDLIELDSVPDKLIPIHNRRVELGGFKFVGYQYSLPWMGGDLEKPDEEIEEDLKTIEGYLDSQTVLVTHSPAYGILDPELGPTRSAVAHFGTCFRPTRSGPTSMVTATRDSGVMGTTSTRLQPAATGRC